MLTLLFCNNLERIMVLTNEVPVKSLLIFFIIMVAGLKLLQMGNNIQIFAKKAQKLEKGLITSINM